MKARVVAVDVGSVRSNFAWAGLDLPGRRPVGEGGRNPEGSAVAVLDALGSGVPVALGFEAPLVVPVSPVGLDGWMTLGRARQGETVDGHSRPWSAGAGSGALATGLVQMAWLLERIGSSIPTLRCTTRPELWLAGDADLFVWEAFVSEIGKPVPAGITQHAADAAAAHRLEVVEDLDGAELVDQHGDAEVAGLDGTAQLDAGQPVGEADFGVRGAHDACS